MADEPQAAVSIASLTGDFLNKAASASFTISVDGAPMHGTLNLFVPAKPDATSIDPAVLVKQALLAAAALL